MTNLEKELEQIVLLSELCKNEQQELESIIDALTEEEIYK